MQSEIVDDATGLTAEWLSSVLGAEVRSVAVEPVGTGQMASCYRLSVEYERGDGPTRLIAKLPSHDPSTRAQAALPYRAEVGFYRDLAPRLEVDAPRCWFAEVADDGTSFTLLLEDMAPATAGDQITGCSPDQARAAAVAVAALHAGSWCDPSSSVFDWLVPPMGQMADLVAAVLGDGIDLFLSKRTFDPARADVLRRFADGFTSWALARADTWSLVHNDYRLDNLLFAPEGSDLPPVTTVDWQSVSTGLPLRDVAFLVGTGLEPDARKAHEHAIVGAYHAALVSRGVEDYGAEQCWDDYRLGLFQAPFICIVAEAMAAPTERGLQMFSLMAERSTTAILELGALDLLG